MASGGFFFSGVPGLNAGVAGDRPRRMKLATLSVHAGAPEGPNAPITTPIVQSTTFRFESAEAVQRYARGEGGLYMYSRDENPTVRAAEDAVAALEGADSCVLFGSGMGAMTAALMALVSGGDEVVAATALYGGTYKLLRDVLSRFGVRARMAEPEALVEACRRGGARLCLFESPTNPTLRVVDIEAVARTARVGGAISLIDSTFAPPLVQRPLALGVDLVMHSATKFLNGHSDHLCGVIAGRRDLVDKVRSVASRLGAALDAEMVIRGRDGERVVDMAEFQQGPFTTAVGVGEMLVEVSIPLREHAGSAYEKVERRAGDWAIAAAAAMVQLDGPDVGDAGISLTAVGAHAPRLTWAEDALRGRPPSEEAFAEAARRASQDCDPIADQRGPADYKRHLARELTHRALRRAAERALAEEV